METCQSGGVTARISEIPRRDTTWGRRDPRLGQGKGKGAGTGAAAGKQQEACKL